jgi:hypothetical protein
MHASYRAKFQGRSKAVLSPRGEGGRPSSNRRMSADMSVDEGMAGFSERSYSRGDESGNLSNRSSGGQASSRQQMSGTRRPTEHATINGEYGSSALRARC